MYVAARLPSNLGIPRYVNTRTSSFMNWKIGCTDKGKSIFNTAQNISPRNSVNRLNYTYLFSTLNTDFRRKIRGVSRWKRVCLNAKFFFISEKFRACFAEKKVLLFMAKNKKRVFIFTGTVHVRTYDNRWQHVRHLYGNLRVSYEISKKKAPPTLDAEYWQEF